MSWVNFRELREKLDFREVLSHYRIRVNAKNGIQHHGPCPFPTHQGARRSTSFSANLDKKIFRCFGCGAQGNCIDFVAMMENLNPKRPEDIRKAALILSDRYGLQSTPPKPPSRKREPPVQPSRAIINAPLDFTLKGLDPDHAYFREQNIARQTVDHFELGFALRGLMQGRIAIALRDAKGQLIGYAGRIVDDSLITEENPKYRLPTSREHDGKLYDFSKSLFLYNGHAIATPAEDLIIASNFRSVWWLWQHGFPHTVALMGSSCSREQSALIVGMVPRRGRVWIFTDGTKVGRYCAEELFRMLGPYRFCRWVELTNNRKPTDCTAEELKALVQ